MRGRRHLFQHVNRTRIGQKAAGSRTLELLLCDLGAAPCGIEVIAYTTGGGETEVERELGLWLGHCVYGLELEMVSGEWSWQVWISYEEYGNEDDELCKNTEPS
jgi:hypothetical protein